MEAVLRVQGITKHYPGFALEDVSFSLAPNRIMGLIGKNGAGKSTTLKAILNMVSPERGASLCSAKISASMKKRASSGSALCLAASTSIR